MRIVVQYAFDGFLKSQQSHELYAGRIWYKVHFRWRRLRRWYLKKSSLKLSAQRKLSSNLVLNDRLFS